MLETKYLRFINQFCFATKYLTRILRKENITSYDVLLIVLERNQREEN